MAYQDDSSASEQDEPWIHWFCSLKGHEMFCKVERSYIEDGFNLYGLRACVANFSDCLDLILDRIGPDDSDDSHLTQSACTLYALIHARYIVTAHGLDTMYNKYANKEFGTCPLIQCNGQPVLPVGLKDDMGADTVKIFCPKCQCVYHPPSMRYRNAHGASSSAAVDGAAFGTTFPHLFLMTFSNLVPDGLSTESSYIPRVFGFRVHPSSRQRVAASANGGTSKRSNEVAFLDSNKQVNELPNQTQQGDNNDNGTGTRPTGPVASVGSMSNDQSTSTTQNKGKKKGRKARSDESLKRKEKGGESESTSSKNKRVKIP